MYDQQQVQARPSTDRNSIQRPRYVVRHSRGHHLSARILHASSCRLSTTVRRPAQDRIHTHTSPSNEHGMSSQITGSQLSNAKQLNKMWLAVARRDGEVKSRRRLAALLSGRKHRSGEPFGCFLQVAVNFRTHFRSSSLYSNNYYLLKCDDNVDFQATDESEQTIF